MTVIRMETGNVYEAVRKIEYAVSELEFKPRRMRGTAGDLKSAWRGSQASKLASELKQHAEVLGGEVANLSLLAQRMRNEINEWESKDHLGAQSIKNQITAHVVAPGDGGAKTGDSSHAPIHYSRVITNLDVIREGGEYIHGISHFGHVGSGFGNVPILAWIAPVLNIIGGWALYKEWTAEDMEHYQTDRERQAAIIVDALMAALVTAIRLAASATSIILSVLGTFSAGITAIIGLGLWFAAEKIATAVEEWFRQPSNRDMLVEYVMGQMDNPEFVAGLNTAMTTIGPL
jgi:hypothetical protein